MHFRHGIARTSTWLHHGSDKGCFPKIGPGQGKTGTSHGGLPGAMTVSS